MAEAHSPATTPPAEGLFYFPRWFNKAFWIVFPLLLAGPAYMVFCFWIGFDQKTMQQNYMPDQPIEYSHALHIGKLGLDCRYCHSDVDKAGHANIPSTETCMACHVTVGTKRENLSKLRESWAAGSAKESKPIEWTKVHKLADYVYFNHSAHVTRGVGCVECHGRVDQMEKVYHYAPLSMGWCLDCHRNPEPHLRSPEFVTVMDYKPGKDEGKQVRAKLNINPSTDCSTCHR